MIPVRRQIPLQNTRSGVCPACTLLASFVILLLQCTSAAAASHGLVTVQNCPYTCETQKLKRCRDWKLGNKCYVEDLSKPPQPLPDPNELRRPPLRIRPMTDAERMEICKDGKHYRISAPSVQFAPMKGESMLGKRVRIAGSIGGSCLKTAGYYEEGELKTEIPLKLSTDYNSYRYEITAHMDMQPEIRAMTVDGQRTSVSLVPKQPKPEAEKKP